MKRVFVAVGAVACVVAAVVVGRAILLPVAERPIPLQASVDIPVEAAGERLARVVRSRAVSYDAALADTAGFRALHDTLQSLYPRTHRALRVERVAELSLLYTWTGTDPEAPPLLLLGHLDTVPADSADEWQYAPFSGTVEDGFVWGRGSIDDRSNVAGILEATELLLAAGFIPRRTILIAFGHDEEVGGWHGATALAALLDSRAIRPLMVLDEGGFVTHGAVPGVGVPVAVVGVAEKGSATFEIEAAGEGGHSSIPPSGSAVTRLASAVTRIDQHDMPARLDGPAWDMLAASAPHMSPLLRLVFANRWLFRPVITRVMAANPVTDATIRTTTAITILRAGQKANVVPDHARATVNFRLLPGDSTDDVADHLSRVIDDEDIAITLQEGAMTASPVSTAEGKAWDLLDSAIEGVFGDEGTIVVPYLVVGGTDARRYSDLSEHIYRFQPIGITPSEGTLLHATNERLGIEAFGRAVAFYAGLMEGFSAH